MGRLYKRGLFSEVFRETVRNCSGERIPPKICGQLKVQVQEMRVSLQGRIQDFGQGSWQPLGVFVVIARTKEEGGAGEPT